ncbi:Deoxyhypusine hydroxylase [Basidiobolus meristosporus CBS 931.73]|uniref:Deoxyhypusine hydroxylase n=1 Tax=Basidiobolus meristosporus CBS 931.73 TaxID=1314790 RepID=A0A1Y1YBV9_9FUNG|nr:Deoxyhypusine hydroxylase [Basidiobolus meristosporus CBS 931.73]|eukprot:ORX95442.1 Deoxyhypusine hydroxylase [Basidiobolus meristosporus CBS 931.73]
MSNLQHVAIGDIDTSSVIERAKQNPETYRILEETLLNKSGNVGLHQQFRALFTLKSLKDHQSIDIIFKAFIDPSVLLRHELAYVLGQMGDIYAVPGLCNILENLEEDPMVRHEAAEALGALSHTSALDVLEKYHNDPCVPVAETCQLAIAKIKFHNDPALKENVPKDIVYTSNDPAPGKVSRSLDELRECYLNEELPLFERYRAMFGLRNLGTDDAVKVLCEGFKDKSALFKHEVAFVLGQMQNPAGAPALIKALDDPNEAPMVRHEAAEALGSIATPECLPVLKKYRNDYMQVVADSCAVALDMYDYEQSNEFQYTILPNAQ